MKDYGILKLLDRFRGLFEAFQIDYPALRKILQVKLLLDSRRVSTVIQNNKPEEKEKKDKNHFISSLWIYLIFGLILIPIILIGDNYLYQMGSIFAIFMFFMVTSLISDFSSVLLDLRDKEILLSRPINSRTLNMAKILHIFFYVSMTTVAILGPSLLVGLFRRGIVFFLIFFMETILINLFLIVLTGLIYLLVLRFFDGERLKDIINYVQIVLTITLSIGLQLIGRVFNLVDLSRVEFVGSWWSYLISPLWFGAPFDYILNNSRERHILIYSLMALTIPVLSIAIYIKLMPAFEENLQKLNDTGGGKKNKDRFINLMARIVSRSKEEQNFYRFSTNMIKNERDFKLKVYPNLGLGLAFPFLMLMSFSVGNELSYIRDSKAYFNIYFVSFIITAMLQFISYSGNYKGAWIYKVMPINYRESIYKGAVKSLFINLFTPLYIVVSIIFLFVFRLRIIPDLMVVYLNMLLATAIIFKISVEDLPFSRPFGLAQKGGLMEMFLSILVIVLVGGAHYLFSLINYGVIIYLGFLLIINKLVWKHFFKEE